MSRLLFLITLLSSFGAIACQPYFEVGIGHKIVEPDKFYYGDHKIDADYGAKTTALFELACEIKLNRKSRVNLGVAHDSQWEDGAPFNDRNEYHKTELFISYRRYF